MRRNEMCLYSITSFAICNLPNFTSFAADPR